MYLWYWESLAVASPQGAAAAPNLQCAWMLPKPDANVATQGGSMLAVAWDWQNAGTIGPWQPFESPS